MTDSSNLPISCDVRDDGSLLIDQVVVPTPYPVLNAVGLPTCVVVMYDPDASPRSWGTFPNLAGFDAMGQQLWVTEPPTTDSGDCYVQLASSDALVAWSWSCYMCEIDPATGRILSRVFTK